MRMSIDFENTTVNLNLSNLIYQIDTDKYLSKVFNDPLYEYNHF